MSKEEIKKKLAKKLTGTAEEMAQNPEVIAEYKRLKREREIESVNSYLESRVDREKTVANLMGVNPEKLTHKALIGALLEMNSVRSMENV